jgi:hypothetical protein
MCVGVGGAFDGFSVAEKKRLLTGLKKLLRGLDAIASSEAGRSARVA